MDISPALALGLRPVLFDPIKRTQARAKAHLDRSGEHIETARNFKELNAIVDRALEGKSPEERALFR
jgi:hypothetical protein